MNYDKQRGFTLIEMIVVITIIAILSGVVVTRVMDKPGVARAVKAKADISTLSTSLDLYRADNFRYPTTDQGLKALVTKPTSGEIPQNYPAKGYIKSLPKDPWGRDYIYLSPGQYDDFDLYSLGADGVLGGEDEDQDITSWQSDNDTQQ